MEQHTTTEEHFSTPFALDEDQPNPVFIQDLEIADNVFKASIVGYQGGLSDHELSERRGQMQTVIYQSCNCPVTEIMKEMVFDTMSNNMKKLDNADQHIDGNTGRPTSVMRPHGKDLEGARHLKRMLDMESEALYDQFWRWANAANRFQKAKWQNGYRRKVVYKKTKERLAMQNRQTFKRGKSSVVKSSLSTREETHDNAPSLVCDEAPFSGDE